MYSRNNYEQTVSKRNCNRTKAEILKELGIDKEAPFKSRITYGSLMRHLKIVISG